MLSFANDYSIKPHAAVLDAWQQTFLEDAGGAYGADGVTEYEVGHLLQAFKGASAVLYVDTGTAANQLALLSLLQHRSESVVCAQGAHLDTFECGALEANGHKIVPVETTGAGKINLAAVEAVVNQHRGNIHRPYPAVLSVANPTEAGTVYSLDDLVTLREYTRGNNLLLHIDGARYGYCAHASAGLSQLSRLADVFSFGGTKLGAIGAEAVIFSGDAIRFAPSARRIQKQMGQAVVRPQALAVQIGTLLRNNLWLDLAEAANQMARKLHDRLCQEIMDAKYPVQTNMVFIRYVTEHTDSLHPQLQECWWDKDACILRFVCSWRTTEDDIESLVRLLTTGSM